MQYTVHIIFGEDSSSILQEVKEYIYKYGEDQHSPYFKGLHWKQDASLEGNIILSSVDLKGRKESTFIDRLENRDRAVLTETANGSGEQDDNLVAYFTKLNQETVNLDRERTQYQLHYCLYFPLYDEAVWEEVKTCIKILQKVDEPLSIDLFGLGYDMAQVFSEAPEKISILKKAAHAVIPKVIESKKKYNRVSHFIVMQNVQREGKSLNLNKETFVKIIGEFALLCIECYDQVFTTSINTNQPLQALGLAVINFDQYYYVEYLIHKAYLMVLEREGIKGMDEIERVDIVKATNKSQTILRNKTHIFSEFFDKEIKTRLENKKEEKIIIEEIIPILNDAMKGHLKDLRGFITEAGLLIPVKRAIFSALLGQDDELFDNEMIEDDTLSLDDIDTEALSVYIEANNALLNTEEQKEAAILSIDGEPVVSPLPEIKRRRIEILRKTGYIRTLESEVEQLNQQVDNIGESKKSLNEDGFYEFNGVNYQLLPKIEEKPLTETYTPHEVKADSVDLRSGFTTIKDQGKTGACTAFSLASICEFFLKSNRQKEFDLSEAFLYYNARKKAGIERELEGCSIYESIESLTEDGICLEDKWPPYQYGNNEDMGTFYKIEPDQEAKDEAAIRKVKKAVNVNLALKDIKSVLEDGYPVEIGTTLCESFGSVPSGFIPNPTKEELAALKNDGERRGHAMVICGFIEKEKLFIVRNSWGTGFGDNGYCYMPYSYILNKELTTYSSAIIELATFSAKGYKKRTSLQFGDDLKMSYFIKSNVLEEELRLFESMKEHYNELRLDYHKLHELVINPNFQNELKKSTEIRLNNEVEQLNKEYIAAGERRQKKLDDFDEETKGKIKRKAIWTIIIIILVWLYNFLFKKGLRAGWWGASNIFAMPYNHEIIIIIGILVIGIIVIGAYLLSRRKKRKELDEELQNECDECNRKLYAKKEELKYRKLRMHLAGMVLSKNSNMELKLTAQYQFMQSFFINMNTWYSREKESLHNLYNKPYAPFSTVLNNEMLDEYFKKRKNDLTKEISLCNIFVEENYKLTEDDLKKFMAKIKEKFTGELLKPLNDFSIYDYFTNSDFELFENSSNNKELLSQLGEDSEVFLRHNKTASSPSKNLFIYTKRDADYNNWEKIYPPYFSGRPSCSRIISPLKIVLTQMEDIELNDLG